MMTHLIRLWFGLTILGAAYLALGVSQRGGVWLYRLAYRVRGTCSCCSPPPAWL